MSTAADRTVVATMLSSDAVCQRARSAAVALGLVPNGAVLAFWGVRPFLVPALTGPPGWFDILSIVAGALIVVGSLWLIARGVAATWRDASPTLGGGRAGRRVWAVVAAIAVALGVVFPPLLAFSTLWTIASVALALRVIDWEHVTRPSSGLMEWRRRRLAWTLSLVVLSHALAWGTTLAHAYEVTGEEFAHIDAIRAGTVTKTDDEDWPAYNLMMSGTLVAGRSVLGDMSVTQFTLGYWPLWAHLLVVPEGEQSPTRRESFAIAAVALAMSLAAWSTVLGAFAYRPVGWGRSTAANDTAHDRGAIGPPDRA